MARRSQFTKEFKLEALRLWKSSGRPAAAVARGWGCGATICTSGSTNWRPTARPRSRARAAAPTQPAVTLSYRYDTAGNRLTLTDPFGTLPSQYDRLNRLTSRTTPLGEPTPLPGLTDWWPAEGTAQDTVGSHPGTLTNVSFAPGVVGEAFAFAGTGQISFDQTVGNFGSSDFTIEFWVQTSATSREALLSKRAVCSHSAFWSVRLWDGGRLLVELDQDAVGTNYNAVLTTQAVNDGQPHRILVVRASTTLRVYIDGTVAGTNSTAGVTTLTNTSVFQAGTDVCVNQDGTQRLTGQLDELAFVNRAVSPTEPAPGQTPTGTTMFAYDALSRRTSLTLPNGTQTSYSYDPASQVTNILHQLTATSAQINQADYVYNNVGNRTQLTDRREAQSFGYDPLDRLTSATHPLLPTPQSFAYDPVGNRTTNGSLTNAGNQLTEDAQFVFEYDANGNQTKRTSKATNNFTVYSYDAENRLVKVEDFAVGNPTPTATSTYRYDGLGRRIEKVTPSGTKRYVYDGEDILLEYDGTNVLRARYTHGPGIDEPIAVTKDGSTFFYYQDGLGSVTDLTDSSGATAKSYAYDAYGNILESPGTVEQPYTYTGREFDTETGLHYYRKRHYDPTTGRFLQKDPIGLEGGPNLYSYTRNNQVNLIDPRGEQVTEGLIVGGGAISATSALIVGGAAIGAAAATYCYFSSECRKQIGCLKSLISDLATCIRQQFCDLDNDAFEECRRKAVLNFRACLRNIDRPFPDPREPGRKPPRPTSED